MRAELYGGGRGIRTPGTLSGTTVFKTAGINRSPIPPHFHEGISLVYLNEISTLREACSEHPTACFRLFESPRLECLRACNGSRLEECGRRVSGFVRRASERAHVPKPAPAQRRNFLLLKTSGLLKGRSKNR